MAGVASCMLTLFFVGPAGSHIRGTHNIVIKWKTFFALLALCEGNPPVNGGFPSQRPVTQSLYVFFDLRSNGWENNRNAGELGCQGTHYDVTEMIIGTASWLSICKNIDQCIFARFMNTSLWSVFLIPEISFGKNIWKHHHPIHHEFWFHYLEFSPPSLLLGCINRDHLTSWWKVIFCGHRGDSAVIGCGKNGLFDYSLIQFHDDVIKWKHFPRYWPFVRVIHRSPVNSPHKG